MPVEIRFYHLERQTLDQILPGLLSKALDAGHKVLVKAPNEKEVERLNGHLWSHAPGSFIPHGSQKDGYAEHQPVFLTSKDDHNPNAADMIILTHGAVHDDLEGFTLCCEMLNGRNPEEVSAARNRWKTYQEKGYDVNYWQQGDRGWKKKA